MQKNPQFSLSTSQINSLTATSKQAVKYISDYFQKSIRYIPEDKGMMFGLPHPYVVPDCVFFDEFFYWDSFFILVGLLEFTDTKELCKGIIQNFAYEVDRFGKIPNCNQFYTLSRSQPPYFAMSLQLYLEKYPEEFNSDWVKNTIGMIEEEYKKVWTNTNKRNADYLMDNGLSRYWDIQNDWDIFAVYESGWDTSSRFNNDCLQINPIDLNSQLYMYEEFLESYYSQIGDDEKVSAWKQKKENRVKLVNQFCWNEEKKAFFDYNFVTKKTTNFASIASFFPFYAGFATQEQAATSIPYLLEKLECEGGLAASQEVPLKNSQINQWDYPHGWAPLHYIAYTALKKYGFESDAQRIKEKWLKTCNTIFERDACFYEKYNVTKIGENVVSKTPARKGFGWSNGIYIYFLFN